MESNSLKCTSIQMVHSIELKFGMYIIGHNPTYCIDFGECNNNSFIAGVQILTLKHYNLKSQIIKSILVSKWCFRLSSDLMCSL